MRMLRMLKERRMKSAEVSNENSTRQFTILHKFAILITKATTYELGSKINVRKAINI